MTAIIWIVAGIGLIAAAIFEYSSFASFAGPMEYALKGTLLGGITGVFLTAVGIALTYRASKQDNPRAVLNASFGSFGLVFLGAVGVGLAAWVWKTPEGFVAFHSRLALFTFLAPVFFGFAWQAYFVEAQAAIERAKRTEEGNREASEPSKAAS